VTAATALGSLCDNRYARRVSVRLTAAERRQQLLSVAVSVFAERGFHATSMNDVAEAAGVTKPVLYQHFTSKRQLFLELLDDVGARMIDAVTRAVTEGSSRRERVERGFRAYVGFVDRDRVAFSLLFGGGLGNDEDFAEAVHRVEQSVVDATAALLESEGSDDHRRLLARALVSMAEGTCRHWLRDPGDVDADQLASELADLVWCGLRGEVPDGDDEREPGPGTSNGNGSGGGAVDGGGPSRPQDPTATTVA